MKVIIALFLLLQTKPSFGENRYDYNEIASMSLNDLRGQYLKVQESYVKANDREFEFKVPIIQTNAHQRAVMYWLKAYLRDKSLKGAPILHMDSHSDLGFAPASPFKLDKIVLSQIEQFDSQLKDISQVLLPAMEIGLSHEFHMCMPPWFKRVPLNNQIIHFSLVEFNKALFVQAHVNRLYPVVKMRDNFLESPFLHSTKYSSNLKGTIRFLNCYSSDSPQIKKDYILSIDLDILSTNGEQGNDAKPISNLRTSGDFISKKEYNAVKKRIEKLLAQIKQLQKRGHTPKIISLSDSTIDGGGGCTPTAIAIFASKYLKAKLRQMFPALHYASTHKKAKKYHVPFRMDSATLTPSTAAEVIPPA